MKLISVYTRKEAIEDGVLIRLDDFFRSQQKDMTLKEKMRFSEAVGAVKRARDEARFSLGELVITPNAAEELDALQALTLLMRHESGDWGGVDEEDSEANESALKEGLRIFSVYEVEGANGNLSRFFVITEWNREATTIMLPSDY